MGARPRRAVSSAGHGRPHRNRALDRPGRPRRRRSRRRRRRGVGARRRAVRPGGGVRRRARILAAPEAALEACTRCSRPDGLVGCGAGGVIGHGREIEGGTAVSVWAASLGDGAAHDVPRDGRGARGGHRRADRHGRPRRRRRRDPARRPGDLPHRRRPALPDERSPMLPLLGGLASGAHAGRRDRAVHRRRGRRRRRRRRAPRRRRGAADASPRAPPRSAPS